MCTRACLDFVRANLTPAEVEDRAVIEVGSLDVNGSVRPLVAALGPASYIGVDLAAGPGVDEICDAAGLVARFGEEAFDLVISTEMIEHVRDWRRVVSQLKRVAKPGGTVILTTRSRGFPYHGFPDDFWRYGPNDMLTIFCDLEIERNENDRESPGVLFKARKPARFFENDLSTHALYSVVAGRRVVNISDHEIANFYRARRRRELWRSPERALRKLRDKIWR